MPASAYPLLRLFFDLPESQVLGYRDTALALIGEGKTIMEVQSRGGQMTQRAFPWPPDRVIFECNAALKHINPRRYGRSRRKTFAFMATPAILNA